MPTLQRWVVFLKEGSKAAVVLHDGRPLSLELPQTVELTVAEADPSVKGATAAAQRKSATLETGLRLEVPPYIAAGDLIVVDTERSEYVTRVGR